MPVSCAMLWCKMIYIFLLLCLWSALRNKHNTSPTLYNMANTGRKMTRVSLPRRAVNKNKCETGLISAFYADIWINVKHRFPIKTHPVFPRCAWFLSVRASLSGRRSPPRPGGRPPWSPGCSRAPSWCGGREMPSRFPPTARLCPSSRITRKDLKHGIPWDIADANLTHFN